MWILSAPLLVGRLALATVLDEDSLLDPRVSFACGPRTTLDYEVVRFGECRMTAADNLPLRCRRQIFNSSSGAVSAPVVVLLVLLPFDFLPGLTLFPLALRFSGVPCAIDVMTLKDPTEVRGEFLATGLAFLDGEVDGIFGQGQITGCSVKNSQRGPDLWLGYGCPGLGTMPALGESPGQRFRGIHTGLE